jgi:hypothetical protein
LLPSSRAGKEAEEGLKSGSSFTIGGKSSAWFDLCDSKGPEGRGPVWTGSVEGGELLFLSSGHSVSPSPAPMPLTTGVALGLEVEFDA